MNLYFVEGSKFVSIGTTEEPPKKIPNFPIIASSEAEARRLLNMYKKGLIAVQMYCDDNINIMAIYDNNWFGS